MIVIGDLHGCYKTFLALLEKLPKGEDIYLVGDLIDRGHRSREVIQYLIDHPEIKCVQGNHEGMLLNMVNGVKVDEFGCYIDWGKAWVQNGGSQTLKSYEGYEIKGNYGCNHINMELPEDHIEYIESLPLYIETEDVIISHTADIRCNWTRSFSVYPYDKKFHIFGHTIARNVRQARNYACVDTGAFYTEKAGYSIKGKPYGRLTAIQYPSLKIFQQENIDD